MIKIGKILQDAGLATQDDIEKAVERQKRTGKFLGTILVEMGRISEADLLRCLSSQMHIDFISLKALAIHPNVIEKVPVKYVWHYKVIPVRFAKDVLTLAVSDPLNLWPLEDIKLHVKCDVEPVLATSADIDEAIRKYYGVGAGTVEKILSKDEDKKKEPVSTPTSRATEDVERMAGDASVIRLVNEIIKEAIENRATDIHFEKYQDELVVRYRVDGMLQRTKVSDDIKFLYSAIVARIKILASLDIVEKRVPQSGGTRVRVGQSEYDLRVSVVPDHYAEGVVIRILPTEMLIDLGQLGMPEKDMELLESFIRRSHGIIYVTGPTGSGKTTTLYACLSRLNRPEIKIITVEDPVEYKLKYIEQVQVNPKTGLTFAGVLRSVLRHDPDVIMIGEVRDLETAEIAVQASLTGHLVLSTLHTNDAPSAVTRLLDMGVEPYLVSSTVIAVIAQRLVRKNCEHCKAAVPWNAGMLPKEYSFMAKKLDKIWKGKGCDKCRGTGYQGRLAIYEILPFTGMVRELAMKKASAGDIRKAGVEVGMTTLFEAGWAKVEAGLTTPEEVMRVVHFGSE